MKVLAISSGGGHWIELLRLKPMLDKYDTHYVTVNPSYKYEVEPSPFCIVRDATSWTPGSMIILAAQTLLILVRIRPAVVVTTGAAPGLLAIIFARLAGAKTVWLDSIANVDTLSKSGRLASRFADLWLTQWDHLATEEGPEFAGKVL